MAKLVVTNGCFDLFHVGHLRLLQRAAELGGELVVLVNSDESIRRLKGPHRPIIPQDQRVEIIKALKCVDHVIVFDEDTPEALIKTMSPDILVKGPGYAKKEIAGAEHVGEVVLINDLANISTTRIIHGVQSIKPNANTHCFTVPSKK